VAQQVLTEKKTEARAATTELTSSVLGRPLKRKEDPRLLKGRSKYVDDLKLPDMLYAAVLRSSYAHALINKIDSGAAMKARGVRLVLTFESIPNGIANALPTEKIQDGTVLARPLLVDKEASYVGEPIAFVVANTRYEAEDALERIDVSYESLPAVVDPEEAVNDSAPKAHSSIKSNVAMIQKEASGDVEAVFRKAPKIVKADYINQRLAPSPIEPRGCLATFDLGTGMLTLWISTQAPFQTRSDISGALGLPESRIRVIAPEVGGGFGAKITPYAEEVLSSIASMTLGAPVKWSETRSENFVAMTHGRGQVQHIEIASNEKGRILGLKVRIIGDAGAYLTEGSADSTFTLKMVPGVYMIPAYEGETRVVLTNKVPHDAYRGASRPEAIYVIERAIDQLARELNLDPAEVRLRNFIPKEDFPFDTITGLKYDSGDYAMNLRKALDLSGYNRWREEQKRARSQGRLIGVGLSTYVEICAFGPSFPQTASLYIDRTGNATVVSGTSPHGQGHETPFAQIVCEKLGISVDNVSVVYGDTSQLPWGTFTAGSRSGALGGSAVLMCAEKIKEKMAKIAAHTLGVPAEDMVFNRGELESGKDPSKKISFGKVASYAYRPDKLPSGMEPVLYTFSSFVPPNYTFPFGTHIAVVELERETGAVKILEYTSVDDCGKVLNPLVVEGQIQGGLTQGLGQALLEGISYDQSGQLLTTSFMDYQIPLAEDVPVYQTFRTETPTYANPLGIKGVGEAGTIAATPTIANAVADVLASFDARVEDMPLSPQYIRTLFHRGKQT
jgi:aerobic carbon-monoxide dehydrogenase large subunit